MVIDSDFERVPCAVAVVVTRRQQVLFGQRAIEGGGFEWQLPGGWIEVGESPEQAARREVSEETGLELQALRFVAVTNNLFRAGSHSISLCFEAECAPGDAPIRVETGKCLGWVWRHWDDIVDDLFLPLQRLRQSGYRPFQASSTQTLNNQ